MVGPALAAFALAPRFPTAEEVARLAQLAAAQPKQSLATAPALSVDTSSREAVRQFYLAVASIGDNEPIDWTGNLDIGLAGETSDAFKAAVLLRINAVRALAGVPAGVTFNDTFNDKAQEAALMMSANNALSHNPPSDWKYYTADGAEAAGKSNLSLGDNGPTAIAEGYIGDSGANNAAVGHRRWLLFPPTQTMGTGDVPATGNLYAANATWVIDGHINDARPATRTNYVAWPAAGYFPAPLIFPRWSFSYPNADFTNATVTMTRDGAPVAVSIDFRSTLQTPLVGENTLVWVYGGLDPNALTTLAVTTDSVFHVTVNNVVINGAPQNFQYDVLAFDPARTASDTVVVTVDGSATPSVGSANAYTATRPTFASLLEWRSLELDSTIPVYDAENGLAGLDATTSGTYSPRTTSPVGAGTASYRLATDGFQNQYLTSPETFYAPTSGSPQLSFLSRLGFATTDQVARVQVSLNDGDSWTDLYTQAGSGSGTAPTEAAFTTRTVSLTSVAGQTFRIRFAFTFPGSGQIFAPTVSTVGWFLDDITMSGVQRVASTSEVAATSANGFDFTPSASGAIGLQARGVLFGAYPMAWGPVLAVTAKSATFANIATRAYCSTGNNVTIGGFVISGNTTKRVLVRAVGPSLTAGGLAAGELLLDPTIEVHDALHGNSVVATNDNVGDNTNAAEIASVGRTIGAADLLDTDTTSAALLTSLSPGVYTFVVRGKNESSGIVLLEIYDADAAPSGATFSNIASRAYCTTGNGVAIGGFVISGTRSKQVLMRAVGPTLTTQGIGQTEVLLDPAIELHDALHANALVATNDDVGDNANAAEIRTTAARIGATALAESDSKSSALLLTLTPGVYSFVASGKNSTSGIVLVEVYDAD